MKCPTCGMADLVHDSRDLPYTYKGESTVISEVTGDYCPACGEVVLDAAESARTSAAMLEFNKQVNASIVDPAFIARVRKTRAWTSAAAEICGGGVDALLRYEDGHTKPPRALVKLPRRLERTGICDERAA